MIKEVKVYYCDICKKQMSGDFGSLRFDMPRKRLAWSGVNKNYKEVCEKCCLQLDSFICSLECGLGGR